MSAPWARRALLETSRTAALTATAPARRAFAAALEDPARAQDAVLRRAVSGLAATRYGAARGVRPRDGYAEFAGKVPVVSYDGLTPWLEKQAAHEDRALVPGPVRFYERTSGSSGAAKDVPYGDRLWETFQRAFGLWLGDLLARGPRLVTGRSWISVSPFAAPGRTTARGVRVGLDDDGEYVRGWLGGLLRRFWTVPSEVRRAADAEEYKRAVAAHLVADADLEIVSAWNPTLFLALLESMLERREEVLADLSAGETRVAGRRLALPRDARRLGLVRSALRARRVEDADWGAVWPRLKLLSAWDMGEAKGPARALAALFPRALFQGKGHLATEAPVSIPWIAAGANVPLVDAVFLEFEDERGGVRRLHELEEGRDYVLLVTPPGGFARYRLGDRVRAGARWKGTPTLTLSGRCDEVCDLVGEKLSSGFVSAVLDGLGIASPFRTLVPMPRRGGERGRYALVVDRSDEDLARTAVSLDAALRRSPMYEHARAMGQLDPAVVRVVPDAASRFGLFHAERGARWGGVKPAALVRDPELGRALAGRLGL